MTKTSARIDDVEGRFPYRSRLARSRIAAVPVGAAWRTPYRLVEGAKDLLDRAFASCAAFGGAIALDETDIAEFGSDRYVRRIFGKARASQAILHDLERARHHAEEARRID